MIGWEFGHKPARPLYGTDWENPLLVSVLIVKHPIDRLFGGSSVINRKYGHSDTRTQAAWWEYVTSNDGSKRTNNYALNTLSPRPCPAAENTPIECLEAAQELVKRFTFVIDVACLDESMGILADRLGWPAQEMRPHNSHPSAAERLGNATLHEWLIRRNQRDIELYEWAKERAVLKCSELNDDSNDDDYIE